MDPHKNTEQQQQGPAHTNGRCRVVRHHISGDIRTDLFSIYGPDDEHIADVAYPVAHNFMLGKIGLADVRRDIFLP
jgi:hypothetical protein